MLQRLEDFDLSPRLAIIFFSIILTGFILGTLISIDFFQKTWLFNGQVVYENCAEYGHIVEWNYCGDYLLREKYVMGDNWNHSLPDMVWVLMLSNDLFGEPRILAFVSSSGLVALTYLLCRQVTGKRYTGLIAMLILIQSPLFYKYNTGTTYPTFWATVYIASVYAMFKLPQISSGLFGVAFLLKGLTTMYLPINLLFAKYSNIKQKRLVVISSIVIGGIIYAALFTYDGFIQIDPDEFLEWSWVWGVMFLSDRISLWLLFASMFCLILLARRGVANSYPMLFSLVIMILQFPIIAGFTTYDNEEYRSTVMIVFIGIASSMIVCNANKLYLSLSGKEKQVTLA